MNLSDLKPINYPEDVFKDKTSNLESDTLTVDFKTGAVMAKFGEIETLVRYDKDNAEVWGKCTCAQYSDLEPCEHIIAVFLKQSNSEQQKPQTPREAKQKAIQKIANMHSKPATPDAQTEQLLVLKADDMDEEIAIKEYIEGSEPLVYRIGNKLVLSIRGWTQAMLYQGNIEIVDVRFDEVGGKSIAKAIVRDTQRNITQIGIAERFTNTEFKWTTLASKAIRNALKKIISPAVEQRVIKEALEANQVIDLRIADLREVGMP